MFINQTMSGTRQFRLFGKYFVYIEVLGCMLDVKGSAKRRKRWHLDSLWLITWQNASFTFQKRYREKCMIYSQKVTHAWVARSRRGRGRNVKGGSEAEERDITDNGIIWMDDREKNVIFNKTVNFSLYNFLSPEFPNIESDTVRLPSPRQDIQWFWKFILLLDSYPTWPLSHFQACERRVPLQLGADIIFAFLQTLPADPQTFSFTGGSRSLLFKLLSLPFMKLNNPTPIHKTSQEFLFLLPQFSTFFFTTIRVCPRQPLVSPGLALFL